MNNKIAENKKVLCGICLLIILFQAGFRSNAIWHLPDTTYFIISRFVCWAILFIMLLYAHKIEKQKLVLYKEKRYSFWKAAGLGFVIFIIATAQGYIVKIFFTKLGFTVGSTANDDFIALFKSSVLYYFFTVITAGITEELLVRGYLQPRFERIFSSSLAGIISSAVIFSLLHLGHGTVHYVVNTFFMGLIFAFFYCKLKNIKILIIVHIIWDCIALLRYL